MLINVIFFALSLSSLNDDLLTLISSFLDERNKVRMILKMAGYEGVFETLRFRRDFETRDEALADFAKWNVHEIRPLVNKLTPFTLKLQNSTFTRQNILSRFYGHVQDYSRNGHRGIWKYLPPVIRQRYDLFFVDVPINWNLPCRENWDGHVVLAEIENFPVADGTSLYRHSDNLISSFDPKIRSQLFLDLKTKKCVRLRRRLSLAVLVTERRAVAFSSTGGVSLWLCDSLTPKTLTAKPGISYAHGSSGFIVLPQSDFTWKYVGFEGASLIIRNSESFVPLDDSRYPIRPCREYHQVKHRGSSFIIDTTRWTLIEIFTRFAMFTPFPVNPELEAIFQLLRIKSFLQAWSLIELYIKDKPYSARSIKRLLEVDNLNLSLSLCPNSNPNYSNLPYFAS